MNKNIIYNYLNNLKKEDILIYANKQGITLTDNELIIIYDNIKNNYENILNNPLTEINKLKNSLNINTYNKILELYHKYKVLIEKR